MTDFEIIEGCKRKERLAQKMLVEKYSKYLFNVCMRYSKDVPFAKDCLQESLIQIFNKIDKYDGKGAFKSWMSTLTVRKCIGQIRKEKRNVFSELSEGETMQTESNIGWKLEKEEVLRYMDTIPEKYRIVINMYLVEGFSHQEIAEYLNINNSTSRSLLTRAKKMIKDNFMAEDEKTNLRLIKKYNT